MVSPERTDVDPGGPAVAPAVGDPIPPPPPPRSEADVVRGWGDVPPVVSVLCATYQHVGFIADAMHGFLGQDTPFPFEVIVRDDASTDGTAEVVAAFRDRYPAIVRAVLEPENRWAVVQPFTVLRSLARGRYVAYCEGDDYWIDPVKLATQVATLEARPGIVLSHHRNIVAVDGRIERIRPQDGAPVELSARELRGRQKWSHTSTVLHRNVPLPAPRTERRILNGDELVSTQLGFHGGAVLDLTLRPSVYRRHPGGVWSALPTEQRTLRSIESRYWIGLHLLERGDPEAAREHFARAADHLLRLAPPDRATPPARRSDARSVPAVARASVRRIGRLVRRWTARSANPVTPSSTEDPRP